MKRMSLNIPDRIYRKWKLWMALTEAKATQEDWICWLFENLPDIPTDIKQDEALLEILDTAKSKLNYSLDQKKIAELIAKGLLDPTDEEKEMVHKLKHDQKIQQELKIKRDQKTKKTGKP